jgi:hypothetical protein
MGSPGQGPAEFTQVAGLVPGDGPSFAVLDGGNRRLSRWTFEGEFIDAEPLPSLPTGGYPSVLPRNAGGVYLAYNASLEGTVSDLVQRRRGPVIAWNGARVDTLTSLWGSEYFMNGRAAGSPAYAARSHVAGDGSGLWIGDTRQPRIELWNDEGLVRRIRWNATALPMTPERFNEYARILLASVPEEARMATRQFLESFPKVSELPLWEELIVTWDGEVWISDQVTPGLPTEVALPVSRRWVILDHEGVQRGEVTTPLGFILRDVLGDQLIGVHIGDFGVESVRAYVMRR